MFEKLKGMDSDTFKELVGKTIKAFVVSPNNEEIYFQAEENDEWFAYFADGDCCSRSWFENVGLGCHADIPFKVFAVLEAEMPPDTSTEEHECLAFYGWSLVTDKGYFDIEMRNSSNGYYGGSVRFAGNKSPKMVKEEREEKEKKSKREASFLVREIMNKALTIHSHIDANIVFVVCGDDARKKIAEELSLVRSLTEPRDLPDAQVIILQGARNSVHVLHDKTVHPQFMEYFVPWGLVSPRFVK